MIRANFANLKYPLVDDLYWMTPPRDAGGPYNKDCFWFPSGDGSRLVPATDDEQKFITELGEAIASLSGFACVPGLQSILDDLTADLTPPPARYPAIGDTRVRGRVVRVFDAPGFLQEQSLTPPAGWTPAPPPAPQEWIPAWTGIVIADIAANGYSTPPAQLVEASSSDVKKFRFQFKSTSPVSCGACTFDIAQGFNFEGVPTVPVATNVVNV